MTGPESAPDYTKHEREQNTEPSEASGTQKDIDDAMALVRREVADAWTVGKSQHSSEGQIVIPLTSSAQKDDLLRSLHILQIYPWEEEGCLIIERKEDADKIRGPKEEGDESDDGSIAGVGMDDPLYRFPLEHTQETTAKRVGRPVPSAHTDRPTDLVDELKVHEDSFLSGVSLEDEGNTAVRSSQPASVTRKYYWKDGVCYRAEDDTTVDDERHVELFRSAQEGDAHAKEELIQMHIGLVYTVLDRVLDRFGGPKDDLFQEGLIGLLRAIEKYDPAAEGGFAAYAIHWIEGRMRQCAFQHRHPIYRPSNLSQELSNHHRSKPPAHDDASLEATDEYALTRLSGVEWLDTNEVDRFSETVGTPVSTRGDSPFVTPESVEREAVRREIREGVVEFMQRVPPRERLVLCARFGIVQAHTLSLDDALGVLKNVYRSDVDQLRTSRAFAALQEDITVSMKESQDIPELEKFVLALAGKLQGGMPDWGDGYTMEKIGTMLGVSRDRIRQIEAKALSRLKHPSVRAQARALLDAHD